MPPRCDSCVYWIGFPDDSVLEARPLEILGQCRRRPPTFDGWPPVSSAQWCGEYAESVEALDDEVEP